MVNYGIYYYFAMVFTFSVGLIVLSSRHWWNPITMEHFAETASTAIAKDGDIVVNVSLIARSVSKELGKLAKEISKNFSEFK